MSRSVYQTLRLSQIIDHPINHSIYQDNFDDEMVESVRLNGVLNPITVCKHPGGSFVCLSGHRRRQAAKLAGLTEIPALVLRDDVPDYEQVIFIVESNRQRDKTTEQKARETSELTKARAIAAKIRMKAGKKQDSDPVSNLTQGSQKRAETALESAAKETGLGGRVTAEKALKVVEKIDALAAAGETVKAEQLRETLNERSVSAAARLAETIDEEPEAEPEPEVVLDELGKPVPEDLSRVFLNAANIEAMMRAVSKLKGEILKLCDADEGRWINRQRVEELAKDLRSQLKFGQPYTICPDCRNEPFKRASCKTCRARGWIVEMGYKALPKEQAEWLANR